MKNLKTIIIGSFALIGLNNGANAQNVNIPDAKFKAALVADAAINTNADTEIQVSEAAAYTGEISVDNIGISSLTGIEAFTAIYSLVCSRNSLSSLDVSKNTALTTLDCSRNSLSSLDVSKNTALTTLWCRNNLLSSINVANGNNANMGDFDATASPKLACIQVDSINWATDNWGQAYDDMYGDIFFHLSCVCLAAPLPTITVSGSTTLCQGSSVTLTSSTASSYLWSNAATTKSITVKNSGNYYVTIIDNNNGCSLTSASARVSNCVTSNA